MVAVILKFCQDYDLFKHYSDSIWGLCDLCMKLFIVSRIKIFLKGYYKCPQKDTWISALFTATFNQVTSVRIDGNLLTHTLVS